MIKDAITPALTGYYPCMKNGSQTVHKWLGVSRLAYPQEIKYEPSEGSWCIWRDPVERFQSAINHMKDKRPLEEVFEDVPTICKDRNSSSFARRHYLPQINFMGNPEDHERVFLIGEMKEVRLFLQDRLGKKLDYHHVNRAINRPDKRWRSFHTYELEMIKEYYAEDIEIYSNLRG